jgi:DNA-binding MarR family transcriptional regulator
MDFDPIDEAIAEWVREEPALDVDPMRVIGRIMALARLIERDQERTLRDYDLRNWSFEVLTTLRRQGEPYELSPTELLRRMMLSSGAMTNRIDRLEQAGLIARRPDSRDRRGWLIGLTPKGLAITATVLPAWQRQMHRCRSPLNEKEHRTMERLLKKMLLNWQARAGGKTEDDGEGSAE